MIERHVTFHVIPGKEKEFEILFKTVQVYEVITQQ